MNANKKTDRSTRQIERVLCEHYLPRHPHAQIEVYRYNSASIRIRILDPDFAKVDLADRDEEVWQVLAEHLSEDLVSQVSLVLPLAPGEGRLSLMNREFENPTPSRL